MSTPDNPRPVLSIAGHEHADWLRYSLDSDLFTPADAFSLSLACPAGVIPEYVVPWAEVCVELGGRRVLSGKLDSVRRRAGRDGLTLELAGRDSAAVLLDCSAPIFTQRKASLDTVVASCVRPLGIADITVQRSATFRKVTIEPGMSAWDALSRAAEACRMAAWFEPDGRLVVGRPDYTQDVYAELRVEHGKTNVLSLDIEEGCAQSYSKVTVLGQSYGDEEDEGEADIQAVIRHPSSTWNRPLIRVVGEAEDDEEDGEKGNTAAAEAKKIMDEARMTELTVSARVAGHLATPRAEPWAPGVKVHVRAAEMGFERDMLLARRTFCGGRDGTFTDLTLKPWGVWLA